MLKKHLFEGFFLLLSIALSVNLFGQGYAYSRHQQISKLDSFELKDAFSFDSLVKVTQSLNRDEHQHLIFTERDTFSLINGRFDVLTLEGRQWNNLYTSSYKGFTFSALPFIRKDTLLSIGGYGYWTNHSKVLFFDKMKGEWELYSNTNDPHNYSGTFVGANDDYIFSFNGFKNRDRNSKNILSEFYVFDFAQKSWNLYHFENIEDTLVFNASLYDYSIPVKQGLIIVDSDNAAPCLFFDYEKKSLFSFPRTLTIPKGSFIVNGSQITIYHLNNSREIHLDLNQLLSDLTFLSASAIKETKSKKVLEQFTIPVLLILVLIMAAYIYIQSRKRKDQKSHIDKSIENQEIQRLLQLGKASLSSQELDEFLNIAHIHPDQARTKRAEWIKTINSFYRVKHGKDLIERKRNPEDKRYFLYFLSNTR